MSSNNDKRELLKLKQGLIEDSDVIKRDEPEVIVLRGKKKVENFFYHYKIHVIVISFFTILGIILVGELIFRKRSDLDFLLVGSSDVASYLLTYDDVISETLSKFTPDFDDNGYSHAAAFPINLYRESDSDMFVSNQTKLFAEIQTGTSRFIIGNRSAFERIIGEEYSLLDVFVDLSLIYTRDENIVDFIFYKLKGSMFESLIINELDAVQFFPDDMYIAILDVNRTKKSQQTAHEYALEVLDNIVRGRIVNQ